MMFENVSPLKYPNYWRELIFVDVTSKSGGCVGFRTYYYNVGARSFRNCMRVETDTFGILVCAIRGLLFSNKNSISWRATYFS